MTKKKRRRPRPKLATLAKAITAAPHKPGRCTSCGEDHNLFPVSLQVGGKVIWKALLCRMCVAVKHVKVSDETVEWARR